MIQSELNEGGRGSTKGGSTKGEGSTKGGRPERWIRPCSALKNRFFHISKAMMGFYRFFCKREREASDILASIFFSSSRSSIVIDFRAALLFSVAMAKKPFWISAKRKSGLTLKIFSGLLMTFIKVCQRWRRLTGLILIQYWGQVFCLPHRKAGVGLERYIVGAADKPRNSTFFWNWVFGGKWSRTYRRTCCSLPASPECAEKSWGPKSQTSYLHFSSWKRR